MVRWLLPIVAMLAVPGRAVTTYAAAGPVGSACCCPSPDDCKCHDDTPSRDPVIKRCGTEPPSLISPAGFTAVTPELATPLAYCTCIAVSHRVPQLHDTLASAPEKPPF
ncbi:MAG: hypothetical protein WKG01_24450 [Kofleriaceae bacterium]